MSKIWKRIMACIDPLGLLVNPKKIIYQRSYHWEDLNDIGDDIYYALEGGEFADEFKGKIIVTLEHYPNEKLS